MIAPLLFAAALSAAVPAAPAQADTGDARYRACAALTATDPAAAQAEAEAWQQVGGSAAARQCLGLALLAQDRFAAAAAAFEGAAREADILADPRGATFWVEAGNAALAGGDATGARMHFGHALDTPGLAGPLRGEALIDRARAHVAVGDVTGARADLDAALGLVPADPFGWLLSATLARRAGDNDRANHDIAEAIRLAPDDAAVALEAGNIAHQLGAAEAARVAWERAAAVDRDGPAGRAAAAALSAYSSTEPVAP